MQVKKQVKAYLNPLFKLVIQLSVAEFHFVKPSLIKHVLLVWMGHKLVTTSGMYGLLNYKLSKKGEKFPRWFVCFFFYNKANKSRSQ